ncbi:hypothetical protein IKQ21_06405, partial [bacterium]|nr:hypothetical protein [bacterium]
MTITWKQIDTNGNGYVDGAECTTAKAKGVKNVWDNMTAMDYNTGITREQKLASIIKEFNGGMYQDEIIINCYFGEDADKLRSNDIKNKENQLITMYNQYIQY